MKLYLHETTSPICESDKFVLVIMKRLFRLDHYQECIGKWDLFKLAKTLYLEENFTKIMLDDFCLFSSLRNDNISSKLVCVDKKELRSNIVTE